ncbi:unnamed protein product [Ectocarpus sp. CCAP 1310/34]|nr:unnamed protein product [Ectocarpus sp. CCAP 1310/34]CAB1099674.1 unnamed protein product [Ectocarpus sp. CCAP 1310/34]
MPPVIIVGCGIRDAAKYGRVGLHLLDTTFFSHARFDARLLKHELGADSGHSAVRRTLNHCHSFFQNARNLGTHVASKFYHRRRHTRGEGGHMDMSMGAMSANGCQSVMERVLTLLEALEEDDVDSKDFGVFSLATHWHNGDTLHPEEFFGLVGETTCLRPSVGRMMIQLPTMGKQPESAVESLSAVCMEHGIEGAQVVRCQGVLFDTTREETRLAFFGLHNVDANAHRTAQDMLAIAHVIELRFTLDAMCLYELANDHWTTKTLQRETFRPVSMTKMSKEGEVSSNRDIRRMLDERPRRLSGGSNTPSDASSTTDEDRDV